MIKLKLFKVLNQFSRFMDLWSKKVCKKVYFEMFYQIVWPEEILFLDIEEIEAEFEDFDFVEFQSCRLFDFVEIDSSEILLNGRHCSDKLKKSYNQLRLSFILHFYLYIHDVHASMLLSKCLFFPFKIEIQI